MKSDLKRAISALRRLNITLQGVASHVALRQSLRALDRAREMKAKGTK